jgi:hypothetical protein
MRAGRIESLLHEIKREDDARPRSEDESEDGDAADDGDDAEPDDRDE